MPAAPDLPILAFPSAAAFERWLVKNHASSAGLWLRIYKKGSDEPTVTYAEALDSALCYGWIDGQKGKGDDHSWLQRFTPRRARSPWSKRNTEHAARLIKEKKMKPAGLAQIDAAKKDGRWDRAYAAASTSSVPEDFLRELRKHKKALAFFETLNKANTYAISYRLQTAKKPETRAKRLQLLLAMMKQGKAIHPQRGS